MSSVELAILRPAGDRPTARRVDTRSAGVVESAFIEANGCAFSVRQYAPHAHRKRPVNGRHRVFPAKASSGLSFIETPSDRLLDRVSERVSEAFRGRTTEFCLLLAQTLSPVSGTTDRAPLFGDSFRVCHLQYGGGCGKVTHRRVARPGRGDSSGVVVVGTTAIGRHPMCPWGAHAATPAGNGRVR